MKQCSLVFVGFLLGALVMFFVMPELSFEPHTIDIVRSRASSSVVPVLQGVPYVVTHVVDGDTVDVQPPGGDSIRVRLIGIDTPEVVDPRKDPECYGRQASERLKELVSGKIVQLQSKPDEDKDAYGRFLRYVELDGQDVGATMLQEGYAQSLCNRYPHPRCVEYEQLQGKAMEMHLGRWAACAR